MAKTRIFGLAAEFYSSDDLLAATKKTYAEGYRRMNAYTPFPVHGLAEAVGYRHRILPWIVFAGGLLGGAGGFGLQYWVHVIEQPYNIGGRPLLSWPAFIPVTFECTILAAALTAVLGMLALNGLPQPYHPVFNHPRFGLASTDRFFLVVQARDERFERESTERFLESLGPREVVAIEP